ncbi:hypothetical protein CJD36_019220 [Flavipsychrobacter stenotrophus]|uniref:Uncharacterized protein n=1 Tax=Flavipsychrobacter stenotrophus TaxID=2077091 RepID=A0A2S7SR50_9BACT|nr:hypothetical protein [Flavipsychrobacter stenotrophus]PQJ09380.1 hypothetical protein CJD36_019220 [Flavipsychrobacter stenotrophus]
MIDGFKAIAEITDFEEWKKRTGLTFYVGTDDDTGELKNTSSRVGEVVNTYECKFEEYTLTVKQTNYFNGGILGAKSCLLFVKGSFHKNYFNGVNFQQFPNSALSYEVYHLSDVLCLSPSDLKLQNIEVGVNVPLSFGVSNYIANSVLLHRTVPFIEYKPDTTGLILGRYAPHTQHSIKCYDKGLQNKLDRQLMRFEVRYTKMQPMAIFGIATFADLLNKRKVAALGKVLTKAWDNILISEPGVNLDTIGITDIQRELLLMGKYRDYWQQLHQARPKYFNKQRTKFRDQSTICGGQDTQGEIRNLILSEWGELCAG